MSTNLLEQLRAYGEDFDADMSPVTLDELVRAIDGPVRVQPLNTQIRRPIPGWVSAITAAAVVLLIGGVAFLLRDSGGPSAPAAPIPTTVAPTTVTETADPTPSARWSRVADDEGVFGGPGEQGMESVTAGGPGLVAVGGDGADAAVWTSVDGSVWSRVPNSDSVFGNAAMSSVIASGQTIVAVGAGEVRWAGESRLGSAIVWTSLDGFSWTRVAYDANVFGNATMADITVGGPGFVAVGSTCCDGNPDRERDTDGGLKDSERDAVVWTSVDGESWSRVAHDETVFGGLNNQSMISITAGGPGLVAVGYDGTHGWDNPLGTAAVWTSVDGLSWSRIPQDEAVFGFNTAMVDVTAGGRGLVAVGYAFNCRPIWTSADGVTWLRVPTDVPGACNKPMRSVIVDGKRLVAVGHDASSWTSVDGITWTLAPSNGLAPGTTNQRMTSVTGSDVGLVAVGDITRANGGGNGDAEQLDADGDRIAPVDAAVWLQE